MLERTLELKRNSFFVFVLRVLPIIFWGGVVAIWAFRAFDSDVSKYLAFLFFVFSIVMGVLDLKNNSKSLKFSNDGISILKKKKGRLEVEKFIAVDQILDVECSEKSKKIVLVLEKGVRFDLLKYNSATMLGAEKFFIVKAELCRYFPNKAHLYIDDGVKAYIESGVVSEFVKSKEQTGRAQAGVLLFAELVFAIVPLGIALLASAWVFVKLLYCLLSGIIFILDSSLKLFN